MKIGLITEGAKDGADQKVCEHLIERVRAGTTVLSRPLGNLPALKTDCGNVAALLLAEGCDHVLILWDLYPAWREDGGKPSCKEDRKTILGALAEAGVAVTRVSLICIEEELEAWLLADSRAVTKFCQSINRDAKPVPNHKYPERIDKPKTRLIQFVKERTGRLYTDRMHAPQIIERLPDLKRLRRSETFKRFEAKILAVP